MRINSQFKDYYDFVANQFGGGDPRIVYSRQRIVRLDPKQFHDSTTVHMDIGHSLYDPARYDRYCYLKPNEPHREYMYLVVAGKPYLLVRLYTNLISRYDISTYKVTDHDPRERPKWMRLHHLHPDVEFGKEYDFLIQLSRKIGTPVFAIEAIEYKSNSQSDVVICGQCPILGRIGMASRVDPYQMYQDIAMFVGNKMKKTPDTQPPVELDNKQKILKAGFDLKQSFRHRV